MKKQNTIIAGLLGQYLGKLPDAVAPQPSDEWAEHAPLIERAPATSLSVPLRKVHLQDDFDTTVFDVECYPNYFLLLFMSCETGDIRRFQQSPNVRFDVRGLLEFLKDKLIVGFNSKDYDIPMMQLAIKGYTCEQLKKASDQIIVEGMYGRDFQRAHNLTSPPWNHIDLKGVAPGIMDSLKIYAGRLHCAKMQDLPYDPNLSISAAEALEIKEYCGNDLGSGHLLLDELKPQIELRQYLSKEYGQDLRSKSDAQMAEHIIAAEVKKINGTHPKAPTISPGTKFQYQIPAYVKYDLPWLPSAEDALQAMLEDVRNAQFTVNDKGSVDMPAALEAREVKIGGGTYRMGIGGLHSTEKSVGYRAGRGYRLKDRDVASFYPKIVLNQKLFPKHMGPAFLTVYDKIVVDRLAAKKAKNKMKAESLKIAVNGTFGKLGNKYACVYAPDLMIQVTLTGQLSLLMLIARIEEAGIKVVSANTDGIVMWVKDQDCAPIWGQKSRLDRIIAQWEADTQFETEETEYSSIWSKDVNNYIAIKTGKGYKSKGLYANPWDEADQTDGRNVYKLQKNPSTTIVIEAVIAMLSKGTPLETTVRGCQDIRKFIAVRRVNGGAEDANGYVGKAVRWYYATASKGRGLTVAKGKHAGNRVPKTDMMQTLMQLPAELPTNINYEYYIAEAKTTLKNIGFAQRRLFDAA